MLLVEQGEHLGQVRGAHLEEQFRAAAGGAAAGRAVGTGDRGQAVRLEQRLQLADLAERPASDQGERLVRTDGLGPDGPLPVENGDYAQGFDVDGQSGAVFLGNNRSGNLHRFGLRWDSEALVIEEDFPLNFELLSACLKKVARERWFGLVGQDFAVDK